MGIVAASVGREKEITIESSGRHGHRLIVSLTGGHGPDDASELVGDGDGGLVVSAGAVDLDSPGVKSVGWALADVGGAKYRASAVGEEHPDIGIATFGDAS
jgi:hypothetical protein